MGFLWVFYCLFMVYLCLFIVIMRVFVGFIVFIVLISLVFNLSI